MVNMENFFKKVLLGREFENIKGRIILFGRIDWLLHPSHALAKNLQTIGEKNGPKFLYDLGYENGKIFVEDLDKIIGKTWIEKEKVMSFLSSFISFGKINFISFKSDNNKHKIIFYITNNSTILEAKKLFGSKSMVCNFFRGIFSGYIESAFNIKSIKLKEAKCVCKGSRFCEFGSKL
ncbi:MAG: hypothetical protein KJ613_01650 [Nanoarchaeota archaeon]|nr:hypothetical protein [Nanoarchaeota archaeon]MBU1135080.1 hypothetical protein [Nanoarchaeota archaeon]